MTTKHYLNCTLLLENSARPISSCGELVGGETIVQKLCGQQPQFTGKLYRSTFDGKIGLNSPWKRIIWRCDKVGRSMIKKDCTK
ncbi:hypothetical protein AB6A40_006327 [Gnathostoma spinigerum]|uniref:Uncharacterized protein n=1 Tax=Gnathostoma spinigerum TaxID=75299 RepID=A0ABD6ERJ3_9BILA